MGAFLTRGRSNAIPKLHTQLFLASQSGHNLILFSINTLTGYNLGGYVPFNAWSHVAWVLRSGVWNAYVNGILVGSISGATVSLASPITQLGLGVACDNWNLTLYKYLGKIFQPIITTSAKYVSNFVPANDLSIGAASQPVAFFMNPGIAGNLTDLVTASSVSTYGTAVTQAPRYLTY